MKLRATLTALLPLILTLHFQPALAQDEPPEIDVKKLDRQGEKQIDNQEWIDAVKTYKQLVREFPSDEEYSFMMGLATLKSGIQKERAEKYFEAIDPKTIPQKNFFYGQSLLYNEKFNKAFHAFEDFKPQIDDNEEGKQLMAQVNNFIKHTENGEKLIKSPNKKLRVDVLDKGVNTNKSEYAPVVYEDENVIFFTAMDFGFEEVAEFGHGKDVHEEIYVTTYNLLDDEWSVRFKPKNEYLNPEVNSEKHNQSGIIMNEDNSNFIFYRSADLWESKDKAAPEPMNVEVGNLNEDDMTGIYTDRSGEYRFMVTDVLPKGKGSLDIYVSKKERGSWSQWEPIEGINTPFEEDSPYLAEDGTLYFSSNGPNSMGGHDIFKAEKTGDKSWGNPENMGVPINSTGNDIHFVTADDEEETFYLASDRAGGHGNTDIYRIWTCHDIPETTVKGRLIADKGKHPQASLPVFDENGKKITSAQYNPKNGEFEYKVKTGKDYSLAVVAENYLNDTAHFSIPEQCAEFDLYQKIELELIKDESDAVVAQSSKVTNAFYDIDKYRQDKNKDEFLADLPSGHRLTPDVSVSEIELETPALLAAAQFKDVRFGFDSDKIDGTAESIIDKVKDYMVQYEDVTVQLDGHTDTKGPAWYNDGLSKRRAESVAKVLKKAGVASSRIKINAHGESEPLVKDFDEDGNYLEDIAAQNRRVEIELIVPEE